MKNGVAKESNTLPFAWAYVQQAQARHLAVETLSRLSRKKHARGFSQIASERVTSVREGSRRKMQKSRGRKKDESISSSPGRFVVSSNALCVRMQIPVWSATSERTFICHAVAWTYIHARYTRAPRRSRDGFSPFDSLPRSRPPPPTTPRASHSSLLSTTSHPLASRTNFHRPRRPCTLPRLSATVISWAPRTFVRRIAAQSLLAQAHAACRLVFFYQLYNCTRRSLNSRRASVRTRCSTAE